MRCPRAGCIGLPRRGRWFLGAFPGVGSCLAHPRLFMVNPSGVSLSGSCQNIRVFRDVRVSHSGSMMPAFSFTPLFHSVTPLFAYFTPPFRSVTPLFAYFTPPFRSVTPLFASVTPPFVSVTPLFACVTPPSRSVTPPFRSVTPPFAYVMPPFRSVMPLFACVTPPFRSVTPPFAYGTSLWPDGMSLWASCTVLRGRGAVVSWPGV
jgi:hypothetical protein